MSNIRVRIAPSPTGPLHVGTARTALFNFLFVKRHGGVFVLRIEDTDLERSDKKYEKDIFAGLTWLGVEADESPEKGGEYGPYRQSERLKQYEKYLLQLLETRRAFYCPHTETELEAERKKQIENKESTKHVCPLRDQGLKNGIIRFKNDRVGIVEFEDLVRGVVSFDPRLLGDFSLAKDTHTPLYNFAVVVDDETMEISHIIRGEDHIPNTPKQLMLIEALGFRVPQYAHLPLILGKDRSKLSKRHGATSLWEYKEQGYLAEAFFNFIALLGWNPGGDREIFSKSEMVNSFSFERVQKSGAIFDIAKLDWMNGEYIRQKSVQELIELCLPYLPILNRDTPVGQVEKIVSLEQPRLKKISEIREKTDYFFKSPEYDKDLLRWKEMTDEEVYVSLDKSISRLQSLYLSKSDFDRSELQNVFMAELASGDKGRILWPLRAALSGKKASPGPFEIMEILGIENTLKRLEQAKKLFQTSS